MSALPTELLDQSLDAHGKVTQVIPACGVVRFVTNARKMIEVVKAEQAAAPAEESDADGQPVVKNDDEVVVDVCPDADKASNRALDDDAIHVSVNRALNRFKNSNLLASRSPGRAIIKLY